VLDEQCLVRLGEDIDNGVPDPSHVEPGFGHQKTSVDSGRAVCGLNS
jgi:hypothetical protein